MSVCSVECVVVVELTLEALHSCMCTVFYGFLSCFLMAVIMVSFVLEMYFIGFVVKFTGIIVLLLCYIISIDIVQSDSKLL
jgi:hypothetical protein